jgi:GST-like protein
VIDKRVGEVPYLAGEYSIADMATYPWLRAHNWQGQKLEDFPNLKKWYDAIEARPAVQCGCAVMKEQLEKQRSVALDQKSWEILFGKGQLEKR